MGGRPDNNTIVIMVWTTIVALAITLFLLANMKLVDRQARVIFRGFERSARKRMKRGGVAWPVNWRKVATQLEIAAQQSLQYEVQNNTGDKSAWWVIIFWAMSLITIPATLVSYAIADATVGSEAGVRFGPRVVRLLLALFFFPFLVVVYIGQCVVQLALLIFRISRLRGDSDLDPSNESESTNTDYGEYKDNPKIGSAVAIENIYYAKQQDIFQIISDPSIAFAHVAFLLHLDSLLKGVQAMGSKIKGFFKLKPPPSAPVSMEYSSYFTESATTITASERGSTRSRGGDEIVDLEVHERDNGGSRRGDEELRARRYPGAGGALAALNRHHRATTPERSTVRISGGDEVEVIVVNERGNGDARRGDEELGAPRTGGTGGILPVIDRYRRALRGLFPKKPEVEEV
ncbi:hypothetical protein FQN54_000476 [Arachnomyces sp. PD_36]|nr:hypothetical protein FQN54_000476 [Arachnomyces sp. PD_36]